MLKRYTISTKKLVQAETGKTLQEDPHTKEMVKKNVFLFREAAMFGLHLRATTQLSTLTLEQQLRQYYQDKMMRELKMHVINCM